MKTLLELLEGFPPENQAAAGDHPRVRHLTSDSREVRAGTVFVAIRGGSRDGHLFIEAARDAGAVAVVGELALPEERLRALGLPYVQVRDGREALARLAANFYGHPSRSMLVIGVTGTSGKTTTTYLLESILRSAGHRVGVIGTVNFRYDDRILESTHTTPGSVELQRLLAEMKEGLCTAVVMEVSSHALKQHRTACIAFDGMVFTNLTPEHLDYHPDMEDYYRSKALLFTDMVESSIAAGKRPFAAINADDEYGRRLLGELRQARRPELGFASFGLAPGLHEVPALDVSGEGLCIGLDGIRGRVAGSFLNTELSSKLTGRFNASNLLGALTVAGGLKVDPAMIAGGISSLELVPGRLQRVPNARGIHVLVDYAHKPDALEKVLRTLGEVRGSQRLITVFGCGGDRDRKKRPVMGRLATELSDCVIVTSDNPRTEDPLSIIEEIRLGIASDCSNCQVEPDRRKAIHAAIALARPGDVVLIAGKGHEDYQIIGTRKIHFDDREVALEALQAP
ncbi:MAG: UDP-N-acetylmuramoyl-L-alanyl-D-glutamate--2,6-diaminopimelate ligase [Oligoflexia bacterium]|nr:UDP-N-acetylmuramoyl-L-alanyl-D-glutamate--2,6-diaminopimelate ligase [Oligoflexia bacterium]